MRRTLAGLLFTALTINASAADLGPFSAVPGRSDAIVLKGDITDGLPIQFFNALEAFPGTRTIVLDSLGGSVHDALMVADMLHKRGMATEVPQGAVCASACAFIFLSGRNRSLSGRLGVHQIFHQDATNADIQFSVGDIAEALGRFGAHPQVLAIMLRTRHDSIHIFTPEEVESFRITTDRSRGEQPGPPLMFDSGPASWKNSPTSVFPYLFDNGSNID